MKNTRRFLIDYGFVTLVVALVIGLQVLPGPHSLDDAYITFRYARHLFGGQGFVYNVGQQVLGTTTPLFTLLLAALKALAPGLDFPWLALLISALCDVVTIIVLRRLIISLGQSRLVASVIALVYLLNPVRLGVALGGMETSLVVMWLVLASEAYVTRGRLEQAAFFSAMAFLTRPDTIILPGLLMLHELASKRSLPWRACLLFAGCVAPWMLFATLYFGSPLSNSIIAKTHAYLLPPAHALINLMAFVVTRAPVI